MKTNPIQVLKPKMTDSTNGWSDQELIDLYFANESTDEQIELLESRLAASDDTRKLFVRYSSFVSNLTFSAKSESAAHQSLGAIRSPEQGATPGILPADHPSAGTRSSWLWIGTLAASVSLALLVGLGIGYAWLERPSTATPQPLAWLVNAHDCQWEDGFEPGAEMGMDDQLNIASGVAHLRFSCGADLTIEGPAQLRLLSETSIRLERGKVAVKVPKGFSGFEIFSPQGRILDLGTEFGVAVTQNGKTDVTVFDGEVETFLGDAQSDSVKLRVNESASILKDSIQTTSEILNFVRDVADVAGASEIPSRMPILSELVFDGSASRGIKDIHGKFVGFDSRLSGTGAGLQEHDENLEMDLESKTLKLTTTQSDLNNQVQLETGEYLGFRLSDFGFTGTEDFEVTAVVPNIPNLEDFGQLGIYVGKRSSSVIRGGIIKWGMRQGGANTIFMVNNNGKVDSDSNKVGLLTPGTDLKLVMSRIGGKYALRIENLTDGGTTSLTIKHPSYLDDAKDLQVGIFGANPFSSTNKTVHLKKFAITIWK